MSEETMTPTEGSGNLTVNESVSGFESFLDSQENPAKDNSEGTSEEAVEEVAEEEVEEAMIEVPVQELADIMQLAGYTDYAERIEEYANEPDEQYMDAEEQLVGLSGGLNGPKTMHPPAADGDNPMDTEPREVEETMEAVEDKLYRSYQAFLEEAEIKEED